ncbi:molybdenum cofactor guanylyltransferase [Paenibacillus allorhizosphaerae]|uniref:Probable molybdenum cofactor guanylyltransferase n=1 Tax=Paenibacillus allorhizosphaerae TaxID=2849866 RepID=A0ABN7TTG6_9BACL|nr:molybdenum cofactor guanylyltransferase [Paenibacillus allorhizosphaerae]CAG7648953.1 Molybdenum cofactor guanylyltransferase [Paenibacillus allorhizosphaerae]
MKNNADTMNICGVVLAGGMNRRMGGRPKALLERNGRTFLELQLEEMSQLCRERILVTNEPERYKPVLERAKGEVRVVRDLQPGGGPLAGIQAALHAAASDMLWVVGCDMPCIHARAAEALEQLRAEADAEAAIARIGGRLHPLHGVYHRRCLPQVEAMLAEEERRLMRLFDRISWRAGDEVVFESKGIGLDFVRNINDPEQYNVFIERK